MVAVLMIFTMLVLACIWDNLGPSAISGHIVKFWFCLHSLLIFRPRFNFNFYLSSLGLCDGETGHQLCRIWAKEKKELNSLWGMLRTWGCVAAATGSPQVGSWVGGTGWEMGLTRNMEMGLARNHLELTRNMWRHQIRSWKRSCQWSDVWRRPVGMGCYL